MDGHDEASLRLYLPPPLVWRYPWLISLFLSPPAAQTLAATLQVPGCELYNQAGRLPNRGQPQHDFHLAASCWLHRGRLRAPILPGQGPHPYRECDHPAHALDQRGVFLQSLNRRVASNHFALQGPSTSLRTCQGSSIVCRRIHTCKHCFCSWHFLTLPLHHAATIPPKNLYRQLPL
mgnify:CR=1 FL=1